MDASSFSRPDERAMTAVSRLLSGRTALAVLRYGADLYGTADAASDIDIRVIFAPTAEEILLGQIDFALDNNPEKNPMQPGDLDILGLSLARYLALLNRGDMTALELLNAASHPEASLLVHPQFRPLICSAQALAGGARGKALGRARGALGALSPDGKGKGSRQPTPADVSHCLRMLWQWVEHLETGKICFPRPQRSVLKQIKDGAFPREDLAPLLAEAFEAVQQAESGMSKQVFRADFEIAQSHILRVHRAAVEGSL